jgi:glucosamine--fructose-6-phosphate aminotransferase (isomerizing)
MCGIFGIVTEHEQPLGDILTDAGRRLSYRGYDSVGAATLHADGVIDLRKDAGKVDAVAQRYHFPEMAGNRGILQLRWATFGNPSQANSQPHLDSDGDMVGAHNGNVVNNVELRQQFIAEGMTVRSENDGESCVHAVERYVDRGHNLIEAIRCAHGDLRGDYAFVIGHVREDRLHALKKGSGLVVGLGEGFTVISSDLPSILPLTRKIVRIRDGEIVTFWWNGVEIRRVSDGALVEREPETVTETMEAAAKGGYPHFMLKEIHEQPKLAGELLDLLDEKADMGEIAQRLNSARHLYLVGCGTSYHACILGALYMARLAGRAAIPVLAPQFIAQYGPTLGPDDVGIFVSQSGETKDVLLALEAAQAKGTRAFAMVNVVGSTLMVQTERHIPLACGFEISVPATKTFLNQCVAFLYTAMKMGRGDTTALRALPDLLELTLKAVDAPIAGLSAALVKQDDLYCLGYGLTYPLALEGALKFKEVTYAHAEGILSAEFKHGPLSAVDDGYPVLFIAGVEDAAVMVSGINEVTCRGGRAIVFGEEDSRLRNNASDLIVLPTSDAHFNPILAALPLQLLSYRVSVGRGYDPDFPRNLSKTLTVD